MSVPFKMKGSPMQRNFGIGSPLAQDEEEEEIVDVSGNKKLAEYASGDLKGKTIKGGIKAAISGIRDGDGPKIGGFLGKIFGGGK